MNIKIDVIDIHQVLKASTSENISIVAYENVAYIIADIKSNKDDLSSDIVMCKADYPWIDEPGKTLIDIEVLKSLPTSGEVTITENTLECGNRKISYKPNSAVNDPITNLTGLATIDRKIFNDLIEVEYAMAVDETRPILNGIFANGNEFVALDGYRIAIRKEEGINIQQTLLPTKLIKTYKKIKSKVNEVTLLETQDKVALKVGNIIVLATKIEGEYIRYKSIIPTEFSKQAVVNSKKLLDLLKSYKNVKYVELNFTKEKVTIKAKNEALTIEDKLECKFEGENLEICFDIKYLTEAIRHYDNMVMKFNSNIDSVLITSEHKTDLVLPVKINKN